MADWEHKPASGQYQIDYFGPVTLGVEDPFEDGSRSIREKSTTTKRIMVGEFVEKPATIKTMLDFFDTKNFDTSFTVLTFDGQAADPDTDSGTFYFFGKSKPRQHFLGSPLQRIRFGFWEA